MIMATITPAQIRIIHTIKQKLGLSDEDYLSMLAAWKATSSKDMSKQHAKEFIDILTQRGQESGVWFQSTGFNRRAKAPRFEHLGKRPGMATPAQLRKIEAIWMNVSRQETVKEKRMALNHFLSNRFEVSLIEWVPFEKVGKIIRTLEAMKQQEEKHESLSF